MTKLSLRTVVLVVTGLIAIGLPAMAHEHISAQTRSVIRAVVDSPGFHEDVTTCPADLMGTRAGQPLPESYVSQKTHCTGNPALCLADCQAGDASMCFGLALVAYAIRDDLGIAETASGMLYARACALGSAGGCTNRTAGMRFYRALDPMSGVLSKPDVQICAYRSFGLTCEAGHSWGCAMHGQALKDGIGTAVDLDAANRSFDRACNIAQNTDSPACKYAREWQAE